jgi:hypothetical protein
VGVIFRNQNANMGPELGEESYRSGSGDHE